jgi:serine-type D-Ala-D-Ala carboxypeptidase (penicillin-binding protein 5/6)
MLKKIPKIKLRTFFVLSVLLVLALSIPGGNFYQEAEIILKEPKVKGLNINIQPPAPYPVFSGKDKPDFISAKSALVMDIPSGVVMFEKIPDQKLFPASTTKITTAIVALEYFKPQDILTVGKIETNGSSMLLVEGEKITFENILYGLLVKSANDGAVVIAQNYPGGTEQFVSSMNKKAKELNMYNTHYVNPSGLDDENHYSSVKDLALISSYALKNPAFQKIVSTPSYSVTDVTGKKVHSFKNVNELLGKVWGVDGIKTGWTEAAEECLVASANRNGRRILTVVLGSLDRFGETEYLIEWAYANHHWEEN